MTCVRGLAANAVGHGSGDLSVVIPACNEERRIGRRLERVVAFLGEQRWKSEVLVVVDGSRDRTAEIVRRIVTDLPVRVLDSGVNRGKGSCVRRGMLEARGRLRVFSVDAHRGGRAPR
jgi:glycosyltransferase involved in cell wall biosynthesis